MRAAAAAGAVSGAVRESDSWGWLREVVVPHPHLAFAAVAFLMVLLAENARIPVDNPATHLELTMIHEAMILEYSARHLALIEWAMAIKLVAYMTIGFAPSARQSARRPSSVASKAPPSTARMPSDSARRRRMAPVASRS